MDLLPIASASQGKVELGSTAALTLKMVPHCHPMANGLTQVNSAGTLGNTFGPRGSTFESGSVVCYQKGFKGLLANSIEFNNGSPDAVVTVGTFGGTLDRRWQQLATITVRQTTRLSD
jgi:hypothetical protein